MSLIDQIYIAYQTYFQLSERNNKYYESYISMFL